MRLYDPVGAAEGISGAEGRHLHRTKEFLRMGREESGKNINEPTPDKVFLLYDLFPVCKKEKSTTQGSSQGQRTQCMVGL